MDYSHLPRRDVTKRRRSGPGAINTTVVGGSAWFDRNLCPVAPSWFETRSEIGSKIDTENCCTIRVQSWTGDRDEVILNRQFRRFEFSNRDQQPSSTNNHEISLVQHFYIGTKIKLDPGSELGSFDLGSWKMLVQPDIGEERQTNNAVVARCRVVPAGARIFTPLKPVHSNIKQCHEPLATFILKAVRNKVSTFEINLRKKSLLLPALSDMRPVRLVTMGGEQFRISTSNKKVIACTERNVTRVVNAWRGWPGATKVTSRSRPKRGNDAHGITFACEKRCGRCRWPASFLGEIQFLPPLHSTAEASYSPHSTFFGVQDLTEKSRPKPLNSILFYPVQWNEYEGENKSALRKSSTRSNNCNTSYTSHRLKSSRPRRPGLGSNRGHRRWERLSHRSDTRLRFDRAEMKFIREKSAKSGSYRNTSSVGDVLPLPCNSHFVSSATALSYRPLRNYAGLLSGSPLSPFFCDICTADIPHADPYVDDMAIIKKSTNSKYALVAVQRWYTRWRIKINATKSINLIITKKRTQPDRELKIFNTNIPNVKSAKYLGLTLDRSLTWAEHIKILSNIATGNLISLYPML
ncbi:hypothetical protein PR048_009920 [Dryococelus australis]|uniref:Reverse transcriptase domain-containing protein n=1 Tax=Dryococelus australis TaxID=614101 RepID=A0ABQ9I1B4_9NEOP|nr:hypothetical protein PR048_009920 [Dryococelus australis]